MNNLYLSEIIYYLKEIIYNVVFFENLFPVNVYNVRGLTKVKLK